MRCKSDRSLKKRTVESYGTTKQKTKTTKKLERISYTLYSKVLLQRAYHCRALQIGVIVDMSINCYLIAHNKMLKNAILCDIVMAARLLEMVCPSNSTSILEWECYMDDAPSLQLIAAACCIISLMFSCDYTGNFKMKDYTNLEALRYQFIKPRELASAKMWVLKKLDFGVWIPPFLEQDRNLIQRTCTEVGFLSEQCLYPPSMRDGQIHTWQEVDNFLKQHPEYIPIKETIRSFCAGVSKDAKIFHTLITQAVL